MKQSKLKGFEDVNTELVEIRKLEKLVEAKRQKADAVIETAEKKLHDETEAWLAEIEGRKAAIERFCRKHFEEFGGKSRKLDAGTVLFRDSDELVITDPAKTLNLLDKHYPDGFAVKRSIDTTALKRLGFIDLKKLLVERVVKSVCVIRTVKE